MDQTLSIAPRAIRRIASLIAAISFVSLSFHPPIAKADPVPGSIYKVMAFTSNCYIDGFFWPIDTTLPSGTWC